MHLEEALILVPNADATAHFYLTKMGFETRHQNEWGLHVLQKDGQVLVFRSRKSMENEFAGFMKSGEAVSLVFRSDAIEKDHQEIVDMGLIPSLLTGATGSRSFVFRDPTGLLCFVYCL
jgi:catechol 2,3-dioxygenase-like lactoylglutathione lyase family enzyme